MHLHEARTWVALHDIAEIAADLAGFQPDLVGCGRQQHCIGRVKVSDPCRVARGERRAPVIKQGSNLFCRHVDLFGWMLSHGNPRIACVA